MNNSQLIQCPLCNDNVDKLIYRFHYDTEKTVLEKIRLEFPEWTKEDGLCSRCLDFFHSEIAMEQRIFPPIGPYFPIKTPDDFIVIPTGLRVNADPRFTGKSVTICFIDSGFYPHPDLTRSKGRIKKIVEMGNSDVQDHQWHGTMTSVVCAGDGYLSNGLYKGIASDAELVLLKVQDKNGKITDENILKALHWILENHTMYNIRIVNMSVSGETEEINDLVEQLYDLGIMVVAAAGNDINATIKPPASSPKAITIGGADDENMLERNCNKLYHSSFGSNKPDLVAHAIWIAAPILPGTEQAEEAKDLFMHIDETNKQTIRNRKYISPGYMHVDGTSFAAPITSAVIAQLLEINPALTPRDIMEILYSSAKRIQNAVVARQGYGIIQPRKAILKALKKEKIMKPELSPDINKNKKTIGFYVQHDCASQISVAGSFNHWAQDVLLMEPCKDGVWKIEIPLLPAGKYEYKFFVDEKNWIEDFGNPYREPDGFNGFNSILIVES